MGTWKFKVIIANSQENLSPNELRKNSVKINITLRRTMCDCFNERLFEILEDSQ